MVNGQTFHSIFNPACGDTIFYRCNKSCLKYEFIKLDNLVIVFLEILPPGILFGIWEVSLKLTREALKFEKFWWNLSLRFQKFTCGTTIFYNCISFWKYHRNSWIFGESQFSFTNFACGENKYIGIESITDSTDTLPIYLKMTPDSNRRFKFSIV